MRNDKPLKTRVLISSIILMFMVLCDIYMITSIPKNFQLLAIAACITFLWMTFTLDGWMNLRELASREREEQYQDILKAEKASYLIFQQKFQDLDNKLNFIGQKIMPLEKMNASNQKMIASMRDALGEEQKKIAKVLISRSKENADALINSNGQLMGHMNDLLQTVGSMEGTEALGQAAGSPLDIQSLKNTQNEILAKLQEITSLLANGAQGDGLFPVAGNGVGLGPQETGFGNTIPEAAGETAEANAPLEPAQDITVTQPEAAQTDAAKEATAQAEAMGDTATSETDTAKDEAAALAQLDAAKAAEAAQIDAVKEAAAAQPDAAKAAAEAALAQPDAAKAAAEAALAQADAAKAAAEAAITQPDAAKAAAEAALAQTDAVKAAVEAAAAQTASGAAIGQPGTAAEAAEILAKAQGANDMAGIIAQAQASQDAAGTAAKAQAPKKAAKPNPEDPNRMMSPEDIAALIANSAVEELPETAPQIVEEKPPKPEISDPNKMMSPEDIAALIANM